MHQSCLTTQKIGPQRRLGRSARYFLPLTVGLLSLTMSLPAWAQEQMSRVLTVTGQGEERVATTLTRVNLGVEVQGRSVEEVQREAAQRADAVVRLLRSRNVDKLETTGIRLNPIYNYESRQPRITGYTAVNVVSFEIRTEQAGTILDDAIAAGATRIDGVSFIADEAVLKSARQQALQEATQDAQEQAQAVLSSLGLSQQELVGIQINGASPPTPLVQYARSAEAGADMASTPVVGGEQTVFASVTLQIRY